MEAVVEQLVDWIRESVESAKCSGVVFGLSGGIDSAVVAGLSKRAFPESSLAVAMPCESNPQDERDAKLIADELEIAFKVVNLDATYRRLKEELDRELAEFSAANIKPRLRMTTLYYYAQKHNYLVLGGSNRSELSIGYFTKHGDSGADLLPIADLLKREVYQVAEYLGINRAIIEKKPSAGLWEGQTDEEEMGFGYDDLDDYLEFGKIENSETEKKIESMSDRSAHKREYPKIFKKK